jgi:hypothetical protein
MQSAQWPYPSFLWTSSPAPAAMSCSTTSFWPSDAAQMRAVSLPRARLAGSGWRADVAVGTTALPFVVLDIEGSAGGNELLDHGRVALRRGQDERSAPAENSAAGSGWRTDVAVGTTALPFAVMDVEGSAGGDELLDHEPVALRRSQDERGVPAKKSVAALNSVRPMQSAQRPYPTLF